MREDVGNCTLVVQQMKFVVIQLHRWEYSKQSHSWVTIAIYNPNAKAP
jgi:hypothetical protein